MADSFEQIAVQPSIVRQQWLPLDVAVQELITFQQLYGEGHFLLACHAALPSQLTPELLHAIRLNFLDQSQPRPPWIAEMDFLLSPLCRPLERDLFEVEPMVREAALFQLEELYGWQRLQDVADFLAQYQQKNLIHKLNAGVKQLHTWIAQAYLQPNEVIRELTHLLTASVDTQSSDYETLPKNCASPVQWNSSRTHSGMQRCEQTTTNLYIALASWHTSFTIEKPFLQKHALQDQQANGNMLYSRLLYNNG